MLQSDVANLQRITKELESALTEGKAAYVRRVQRNIK